MCCITLGMGGTILSGKKATIYRICSGVALMLYALLSMLAERICYAKGIFVPGWIILLEFMLLIATGIFATLRIYEERKEKRNCQSKTESTEDGSEKK